MRITGLSGNLFKHKEGKNHGKRKWRNTCNQDRSNLEGGGKYDVQSVKSGLLSYARVDRWNRASAYNAGFNDEARFTLEAVSEAKLGFPSEVAASVLRYNRISEKQAYVIAKAAVDNDLGIRRGGKTARIYEIPDVDPYQAEKERKAFRKLRKQQRRQKKENDKR